MRRSLGEEAAMFISPAFAQGAGGPQDLTTFFLPMVLVLVVFYFLMIRPQQQKQKQLKAMLESLRRGDRVVTAGGLIGSIVKSEADEVTLEIADGVRVRVVRSTITSVLTKPEPVSARKAKDESADKSDKKDAQAKTPETAGAGAGGDLTDRIKGGFKRLMGG
jgi:preprotein translocase subunit YajC